MSVVHGIAKRHERPVRNTFANSGESLWYSRPCKHGGNPSANRKMAAFFCVFGTMIHERPRKTMNSTRKWELEIWKTFMHKEQAEDLQ